MTENYFEKKNIRDYADKRGLKYTEAKAMLEPQNGRTVRVGLDDIKSEIVDHPRVDMMKRADGLGYMNGSLDADTIRSWIPLLDKLDSDNWKLVNGGPGWNSLSYDDAEDYSHAEPPLYCGEYEDGEPTDDVLHTTHRLDQIDGLSIVFYPQFKRDDSAAIVEKLAGVGFAVEGSSFARNDIARDPMSDEEWIDTLAKTLNAAAAAFGAVTAMDRVKSHAKIESELVANENEAELLASFIPLMDKLDDHQWQLTHANGYTQIVLGEELAVAGGFEDGFPQTEDAYNIESSLDQLDGLNVYVSGISEPLNVEVYDGDGIRFTQYGDNYGRLDIPNRRTAPMTWTDVLASALNQIAAAYS